ncbi:AAA family ATPase [Clavibacter sepedonicus]|uniref:ATP-binding protein n=1 Tax=Clavibacter TaxID=1573 RepID=UPI001CC26788|nr:ATP-binding protein [Clavibacter sp.]
MRSRTLVRWTGATRTAHPRRGWTRSPPTGPARRRRDGEHTAGAVVLLNGVPGSGKSHVARRLVDACPGWFLLDIDVLRTSIGGWADDFGRAGRIVRPIAHAIVRSVVRDGGTVVVPQLLDDEDELAGLAAQARGAGGRVTHVVLDVPLDECWRRLQARAAGHDPSRGSAGSWTRP